MLMRSLGILQKNQFEEKAHFIWHSNGEGWVQGRWRGGTSASPAVQFGGEGGNVSKKHHN